MANIFGQELSKRQLMERVGDISQIAGIKRYRLEEGKKDSVIAIDMKNGSGLEITALPGRGMDIANCTYKGIPLAWISKCGISSPSYYEEQGLRMLRNFTGGLLTTCGLTYAGAPCTDDGEELGLHGRISNIAADEICSHSSWDHDDFYMTISGKMKQSIVFGENISLTRKISMKMGENKIYIDDEIENLGFSSKPLMLIYHMNLGFPLIDNGSKFYVDKKSIKGADEYADKHIGDYNVMTGPVHNISEKVYFHDCNGDDKGFGHCSAINNRLKIGVSISFNIDELPNLSEWKMMGQGDYVLGMEPCNCRTLGRSKEREMGTLRFIEPGEVKHTHIIVDILDGEDSIIKNITLYK